MSMTEVLHDGKDDDVDGSKLYVMLGRVSWKQPKYKRSAVRRSQRRTYGYVQEWEERM